MAGNAFGGGGLGDAEVLVVLTRRAGGTDRAFRYVLPPPRRHMFVTIRALLRIGAGRMAVHAARMCQHLGDLGEHGARTGRLVANGFKFSRSFKTLAGYGWGIGLRERGRSRGTNDENGQGD